MTVAAILGQKSHSIITAKAEETLKGVCDLLAHHRIGAVVVTDGTGSISGILSERDIVKAVARDGVGALDRPTADYMTRTVTTCTPADTIADVMAWMTQGRFRHLPVVDGGRLVDPDEGAVDVVGVAVHEHPGDAAGPQVGVVVVPGRQVGVQAGDEDDAAHALVEQE